jgi:hypothetical protein
MINSKAAREMSLDCDVTTHQKVATTRLTMPQIAMMIWRLLRQNCCHGRIEPSLVCTVMMRSYQKTSTRQVIHNDCGRVDVSCVNVPFICGSAPNRWCYRYSPKNLEFLAMNDRMSLGTASSAKMASTGHSGSQAPQSMHSSGLM